jgi:hypothetical protein
MKQEMFGQPKSVIEDQLNRLFARESTDQTHGLLSIASVILFQDPNNKELAQIYQAIGIENFAKLVNIFNGRTITFFKRSEFEDALILALCYFMKEVEGKEWEEIKRILPFEISPISIGNKISILNRSIKSSIIETFEKMKEEAK